MAGMADIFLNRQRQGGLFGGGGGEGSTFTAGGNLVSPTSDPTFARLLEAAQAAIPQNQPSVMDIASQGVQSPLLEAILGPMLQRLVQPQQAQQRQLTEATRATGGLRDSAYGQQFNELLNQQGLQRNDLMAQVLQHTLAPLLNATIQQQAQAYNPARILSDLLGQSKPQLVPTASGQGGGGGWENIPPSLGLATPMMGDSMASTGRTNPWDWAPGGGWNASMGGGGGGLPSGVAGAGGADPLAALEKYLTGSPGPSFPIQQTGENSWGSTSYNPLTDYTQTNMEY